MKKLLFSIIFILYGIMVFAQGMVSPVKWKYSVNRISATEAELQIKAVIEKNWHLYAITQGEGQFELPLEITFIPSEDYRLTGSVKEPKPQSFYDEEMNSTSTFFSNQVTFKQKIKIKNTDRVFHIRGSLSGQACIEGRCTQVKDDFSFTVKPEKEEVVAEDTSAVADSVVAEVPASIDTPQISQAKTRPVENRSNEQKKEQSMLLFFLTSIGAGLLGLLMPCVFPMIPMTVSFFMKQGKRGKFNAVFYGISIVIIFLIFGIVLSLIMGPQFANILSTHWLPNILFAIIFIIFAISMFGYFEITLPSSWVNRSAKNESKSGLLGVFFMALTLVLVSFSCTLPIAGAVALNAAGGSFLKPIIGMLGFSLGIAVPFTLFALFPSLLQKSPKSGSWMNTLKVILAFIELAFALKFLNVPDQTYHWGILDREIYLAFWIVLFTMLGFYLLGKIRFPADDEMPVQKNWARFITSIFVFTFVVYMIPGMFGAPLNAISGWLPPIETHDFDMNKIVREESGKKIELSETPHYADKLHLPYGIRGYFDYNQALRVAKKENKPIFIDFTGHGCTNCRQVENNVWSDDRVREMFTDKLIVLSMYVDDKTIKLLPEDYIVDNKGDTIKMLGVKNTFISNHRYRENSQPCYFIIDSDGSILAGPTYRELNVEKYLDFLNQGLKAYQEKHK